MLTRFVKSTEDGTVCAVVGLTHDELLELGGDPDKLLEFEAKGQGVKIIVYAATDDDALDTEFVKMMGEPS